MREATVKPYTQGAIVAGQNGDDTEQAGIGPGRNHRP